MGHALSGPSSSPRATILWATRSPEVVAALAAVGSDAEPKVSIYTNSSGAPGSSLYVLDNPVSLSASANNSFTAPSGATLDPNTKYWVVFENEATGTAASHQYFVKSTVSDSEDAGASSGWSIADSRRSGPDVGMLVSTQTAALRIAIRGTQEIPSTDAKLSGLALENAADDSAITLSPAFMSSTTAYTASVANAVGEVTVKPTKSHDGAEVEYLDGSGAAIADADGKDGHQVPLAVGANTIRVKVTAQDGVTTETYTLTLTRGPPLWTTRMTVGLAGDGARGFSRVGGNTLGSLTDETFEYPTASTKRITEITASSGGVQLRVRSGSSDIAGLVLEWAGETLPLAEATRAGQFFTWSQTWLNANASALAAANYAATLPEGGRGLVCLRAATEACPSTAIATNSTATGSPAIAGTAQAGQTLTASLGTVTDADGVPSALTWQWVRVASGGTETVVGANSSFYTPAAADVGATIKVKVSFTDNADFSEGPLESAETAAVLAAPGRMPRKQRVVHDAHGGEARNRRGRGLRILYCSKRRGARRHDDRVRGRDLCRHRASIHDQRV